jgi:beta-phosphoglucomutase
MIRGVIFDLDGVIVDTAVFHYKAWKDMANDLGFDIDEAFNETLKGISRMDSIMRVLAHGKLTLSSEEVIKLAEKKNDAYVEMIDQMTEEHILPGIAQLIFQIKQLDLKMALGSASKNAPRILERIGLASMFDAVIDGNSVSRSKPDPEVFIKGAEALGLKPEECLVIEDAFAGIEAAHAAGMKAVGIGTHENLPNADRLLSSFENVDLKKLLEEI